MKTERRLSDLLSEFARTLVTDFPIQSILDHLVIRIVELLPFGSAGVTLISPAGEPRHIAASDSSRRFWKPAVEGSVGEPMRLHDLRHTHVALLIKKGVHPSIIASRLGHTSVKTVLDVYGHLYEGLDRDAADALSPPWDASDVHELWTQAGSNADG